MLRRPLETTTQSGHSRDRRSVAPFLNEGRPYLPAFPTVEIWKKSLRVSFAFPPVEGWFHPSAAGLRRAGLCEGQFSRPSFAFSPRSEHVPLLLVRLDLARNLALMPSRPRWLITHLLALYKRVAM